MVINTNVGASSTAKSLNISQSQLARSLSRLSSGSKIIRPSDDAAGLAGLGAVNVLQANLVLLLALEQYGDGVAVCYTPTTLPVNSKAEAVKARRKGRVSSSAVLMPPPYASPALV